MVHKMYIRKSNNHNWNGYIVPKFVIPKLKEFLEKRIKPTVRGMCYILESNGIIKKIEQEFSNTAKALTRARKNDQIPIDSFSDNTRNIRKRFNDEFQPVLERIRSAIAYLKNISKIHLDEAPRWYRQPNYVEVWLEKEAMADTIEAILRNKQVVIVPNRGWSSMTFAHKNIIRLEEKFQSRLWESRKEHVWILYLGDFDPSGLAMDRNLEKELRKIGTRVHFKRIAITENQVNDYHLKHLTNPDPQVAKKLERDNNSKWFKHKFDSLFQIELEAIQSLPEFVKLIVKEVDSLFDQGIYDKMIEEETFTEDEINPEIIQEFVNNFDISSCSDPEVHKESKK
jgi:hypothetical protein